MCPKYNHLIHNARCFSVRIEIKCSCFNVEDYISNIVFIYKYKGIEFANILNIKLFCANVINGSARYVS